MIILFFIFLIISLIFWYIVFSSKDWTGILYCPVAIFSSVITILILGYIVISFIVSHLTISIT